jgi:hypothetical protein
MPRLRCQRSKAPVRPLSGKNEPEGNLLVDRGVLIGPLEVTLRKSPARCEAFPPISRVGGPRGERGFRGGYAATPRRGPTG